MSDINGQDAEIAYELGRAGAVRPFALTQSERRVESKETVVVKASNAPGPMDAPGFWLDEPSHRRFLAADARAQLDLFRACHCGDDTIAALDRSGSPLPDAPQELHAVTRFVHSYALGQIAGYPSAEALVDAGISALWNHRDPQHGGYVWALQADAITDDAKLAYGHAFVLLAASTAMIARHDDAQKLFDDVTDVIETRFWDESAGMMREEFRRDWSTFSTYRGMNANMHTTEAMLAAFEATGDDKWLIRAGRILSFLTGQVAPAHDWRLPEHYTGDWQVDREYSGNPMFRPAGTTPGHSFELGRLLIQYWDLAGRPDAETPCTARRLIETALQDAWRADGGFVYTLSHGGAVDISDRYWWPVTEAIGALATLIKLNPQENDEAWYRRIWLFAAQHFIDANNGGWIPEIGQNGRPTEEQFIGKPDIYHALQADLFSLAGGLSQLPRSLTGCLDSA